MNADQTTNRIEPLLLTAREAARALGICERTLWTLAAKGEIRALRIGRAVRYDPDDLRSWIASKKIAA